MQVMGTTAGDDVAFAEQYIGLVDHYPQSTVGHVIQRMNLEIKDSLKGLGPK